MFFEEGLAGRKHVARKRSTHTHTHMTKAWRKCSIEPLQTWTETFTDVDLAGSHDIEIDAYVANLEAMEA